MALEVHMLNYIRKNKGRPTLISFQRKLINPDFLIDCPDHNSSLDRSVVLESESVLNHLRELPTLNRRVCHVSIAALRGRITAKHVLLKEEEEEAGEGLVVGDLPNSTIP